MFFSKKKTWKAFYPSYLDKSFKESMNLKPPTLCKSKRLKSYTLEKSDKQTHAFFMTRTKCFNSEPEKFSKL